MIVKVVDISKIRGIGWVCEVGLECISNGIIDLDGDIVNRGLRIIVELLVNSDSIFEFYRR